MAKKKSAVSGFRTEAGKQEVRKRYEQILDQWPVPHERRYIGDTHVIISGDAKAQPLFLLHGSLSNSAAWMGDVGAWSSRFRVIAADIPGQPGLSGEFLISPSGSGYEDWFEHIVDELGYSGSRIAIVGQSLGSFVALKFAVRHPERVSGISMLTTPAIAPAKSGFIFKAMFLMMLGKWGRRKINGMVAYGVDIDKWSEAFGTLLSKNCRPLTEPIPLLTDRELEKLVMPVQLFAGDHDVMLRTEETVERLKRLVPHAEINILEETGHTIINRTGEITAFLSVKERIHR